MKPVAVLLAVLVAVSGCVCPLEKAAVRNIRDTHRIVLPQYLKYVDEDPKLSPDQKEDRHRLVESLERLTESLERSVE